MFRCYHQTLTERAKAVVASNSLSRVFGSMWRDTIVWLIPIGLAFLICWVWGLSGTTSLIVSAPLVGISLLGGVVYVGAVYALAIKNGPQAG